MCGICFRKAEHNVVDKPDIYFCRHYKRASSFKIEHEIYEATKEEIFNDQRYLVNSNMEKL